MSTGLRDLFGASITAAYLRSQALGVFPRSKGICEGIALGFGISDVQGSDIFHYFQRNQNINNTIGFGDTTYYANYERDVQTIIDSYLPQEPQLNRLVLGLAAHSVIWGYALNPTILTSDVVKLMGRVLMHVAERANSNQPFSANILGEIIHPFTEDVILTLIQRNYRLVLLDINQSPKDGQAPMVNYNWYDVNSILSGPDLQIMKDIENQYYFITGALIYSTSDTIPQCVQDTIAIQTETGLAYDTYYRQTPCVERDSYIGPPPVVKFSRIFNDGPSSSGIWAQSVKDFYISRDQHILGQFDWDSNAIELLTYNTGDDGNYIPVWTGTTFVGANGRYDLGYEWKDIVLSTGCPYLNRMHVGDNWPKRVPAYDYTDPLHPVCTGFSYSYATGWKLVSMEIEDKYWNQNRVYYRTNPANASRDVLTRALNIEANPYLATDGGDGNFYPFWTVPDDPTQRWYVGPPQLNGANTLPSFAFWQTFDSPTFKDTMGIVLYPTLSHAYGNAGSGTSRFYEISPIPLISGTGAGHIRFDQPALQKLNFVKTVSSNMTGVDEIYYKFFGMGDAMSGTFNPDTFLGENAGFFYTGYIANDASGNPINILSTLSGYSGYILGATIKNIKYINNYINDSGEQVPITKIAAQDASGVKEYYYYFDDRIISGVVSPYYYTPASWDWFAQMPYDMDAYYKRQYNTGIVENYMPRYSHGPFSIEKRKFLYPNANSMDQFYVFKWNGFPARIRFDLEVREEALKEIYCTFVILPDNSIGPAQNIRVIRAQADDTPVIRPKMNRMWLPDTPSFNKEYDFNQWKISGDFEYLSPFDAVDNLWAPAETFGAYESRSPSGRYSYTLNNDSIYNLQGSLFRAGIYQTGWGAETHGLWTGEFNKTYFYDERPTISSLGLYHGYKTLGQKITLQYVPPIFDLSTASLNVSDALNTALNNYYREQFTLPFAVFSGGQTGVVTGTDPFFLEYVGGRRGGPTAQQEGGYHSHGIIGDKWMTMTSNGYDPDVNDWAGLGHARYGCYLNVFDIRRPDLDDRVLLFEATPTGTNIWMHGMAYYPFMLNKPVVPQYRKDVQIRYVWQGHTGMMSFFNQSGLLRFDLADFFHIKTGSGWYDPTGLTIGPFDRDTEVAACYPAHVNIETQLWLNDTLYVDKDAVGIACPFDYVRNQTVVTGIEPVIDYTHSEYQILTNIPAGKTLNINILGSGTGIGAYKSGYLVFKAHNWNWQSKYDNKIFSGQEEMLDPLRYVLNGTERKVTIPNNRGFQDLAGTYTYLNFSRSGKCYPKPNDDDFRAKMGVYDDNGNIYYDANDTVENYWKKIARDTQLPVTIYGWREGSRMSFTIKNVEILFDTIPYQGYTLVQPSGQCTISGAYGYYAQADNGVFTEGIHVVNVTPNDPANNFYNPQFVSDVLSRIAYQWPSGGPTAPVLKAPSAMSQRLFPSGITRGQKYVNLLSYPPYNYNKLNWPALSDLEQLNPGETLEDLPPDDGNTFTASNLMFSAAQGQLLPNGAKNPNINKTYGILAQFQLYDSTATDAFLNSGYCITSKKGRLTVLSQDRMSGTLAAMGQSLAVAGQGL